MHYPLVSAITPTYGRFHLLREMYWCWLNQDYPNKELIIVNDQKNLTIKCDHPNVKIFNFEERFPDLSSKRNFCIENIHQESKYVLPFDDDDLFLPEHISSLVSGFENNNVHRVKNLRHFIVRNNLLEGVMKGNQPFFGASCFDADTMRSIKFLKGYTMGEDVTWMDNNGIRTHTIDTGRPNFAYRLGMDIIHASGHHIDIDNIEDQKILFDRIFKSVNQYEVSVTMELKPIISKSARVLYNELLKYKIEE